METVSWTNCHTIDAQCYKDQCSSQFNSFREFIDHLKQHFREEGRQWRQCDFDKCNWSKQKDGACDKFIVHLNTHYGNLQIFKCNYCGFKTAMKYRLKQHIKKQHNRIVVHNKVKF